MIIHCMVINMEEEKETVKIGAFCKKCGAKVKENEKFCSTCGEAIKKGNVCPSCGKEIKSGTKFCDKCGASLTKEEHEQPQQQQPKKKHTLAIVLSIVGGVLLLLIIGIVGFIYSIKQEIKEEEKYNNLPIKVDISMSNYYGTIEYILDDFDLDFDLVTKGGNCYSGVQEAKFETEKYGILHTEYSYCKSNKTLTFRVYNLESEQELREPKQGELPTYDKYGYEEKETGGNGV